MIPKHTIKRLKERGIKYSTTELNTLAKKIEHDAAVLLAVLDAEKNKGDRKKSNGDCVILIVRDRLPITIMFRRQNQPFTSRALAVDAVYRLEEII